MGTIVSEPVCDAPSPLMVTLYPNRFCIVRRALPPAILNRGEFSSNEGLTTSDNFCIMVDFMFVSAMRPLGPICSLVTGWPKSNVQKVRAHCTVSDHLTSKSFQGCVGIFTAHWFDEYLKIVEIDHYFFE